MNNIFQNVQQFAIDTGVNRQVKDYSVDIAQKLVKNTLDPEHSAPVPGFQGIVFSNPLQDEDEYIMVHDFFKSSHLDFPAQVLAYESQHPDCKYNRTVVCKRLGLDPESKEPMLCQLIKARNEYLNRLNQKK